MNGGPKERPKSKVTRTTRLLASSISRIRAKRGSRTLLAGPFRSEYPHSGTSTGGVMSVRATAALNSAAPEATAPMSNSNNGARIGRRIFVFFPHFQQASRGYFFAPFPLTPALSLGERGNCGQTIAQSLCLRWAQNWASILPLPKGEGRGEGEGAVEILGALRLCSRSDR